jgi:hypothetical protein
LRDEASLSVAPYDIYGMLSAVIARNRYGLRGTARHIGSFGRRDGRRKSMCPIPGNIMRIGVMDIAGRRLRNIRNRFAVRRPVEGVVYSRPDGPDIVSPVMPERSGE